MDGHWHPVTISSAFDYFEIPHTQIKSRFLNSFLDLPLSITVFVLCLYFMAVVLATLDDGAAS
jgi:hypothetical protein